MSKKASKKAASKKSAKASVANNNFSVQGDGCRELAKASDGKLSVDQCRILRALGGVKGGKEIDRADLKELVGIGRHGLYSSAWLKGLNELWTTHKLIAVKSHEPQGDAGGRAKYVHSITAKGKEVLAKLEKGAKDAAKESAKEEKSAA